MAVSNEVFFGYALSQEVKKHMQFAASQKRIKGQKTANLYRLAGFHLKWLIWNNTESHSFTKYLKLTVVFM